MNTHERTALRRLSHRTTIHTLVLFVCLLYSTLAVSDLPITSRVIVQFTQQHSLSTLESHGRSILTGKWCEEPLAPRPLQNDDSDTHWCASYARRPLVTPESSTDLLVLTISPAQTHTLTQTTRDSILTYITTAFNTTATQPHPTATQDTDAAPTQHTHCEPLGLQLADMQLAGVQWDMPLHAAPLSIRTDTSVPSSASDTEPASSTPSCSSHTDSSRNLHSQASTTSSAGVRPAQWLNAPSLWARGVRGQGVRVAVFDTGLHVRHPCLNVREVTNWTEESDGEDGVGHGTFVAGVIAGGGACAGAAPDAEVLVVKVFTKRQESLTSWFLDAFNYIMERDVDIVNLSVGGPDHADDAYVRKVRELVHRGITVVSAIGNDGPVHGSLSNPADMAEVIGVGGAVLDERLSSGDGFDLEYTSIYPEFREKGFSGSFLPNRFANGARVATFSSRGEVTWGLPQGAGRIKPDLLAPAQNIRSVGLPLSVDCASGATNVAGAVGAAVASAVSRSQPLDGSVSTIPTNQPSSSTPNSCSVTCTCATLTGTSVAAPIVTAALALLLSELPRTVSVPLPGGDVAVLPRRAIYTPALLKKALHVTARPLPVSAQQPALVPLSEQGAGLLDIAAARAWLQHVSIKDLLPALFLTPTVPPTVASPPSEQAQQSNDQSRDSTMKAKAGNHATATPIIITNAALHHQLKAVVAVPSPLAPAAFPAAINYTDCPHQLPYCTAPLYHTRMPVAHNITLIVPAAARAEVVKVMFIPGNVSRLDTKASTASHTTSAQTEPLQPQAGDQLPTANTATQSPSQASSSTSSSPFESSALPFPLSVRVDAPRKLSGGAGHMDVWLKVTRPVTERVVVTGTVHVLIRAPSALHLPFTRALNQARRAQPSTVHTRRVNTVHARPSASTATSTDENAPPASTDDDSALLAQAEHLLYSISSNTASSASPALLARLRTSSLQLLTLPITVEVIPTPPRSRRLLFSAYHQLHYPLAYVPRDDLAQRVDLLDWLGDHPHTNYRDWAMLLAKRGYYMEVLSHDLTCFDARLYSTLLLVDTEREYTAAEAAKLHVDVREHGLSILVVGEWYNEQVLSALRFHDANTARAWAPVTGGANVPALNDLLAPFGIAFGNRVLRGKFRLGGVGAQYSSGTHIARFPKHGHLAFSALFDVSPVPSTANDQTGHRETPTHGETSNNPSQSQPSPQPTQSSAESPLNSVSYPPSPISSPSIPASPASAWAQHWMQSFLSPSPIAAPPASASARRPARRPFPILGMYQAPPLPKSHLWDKFNYTAYYAHLHDETLKLPARDAFVPRHHNSHDRNTPTTDATTITATTPANPTSLPFLSPSSAPSSTESPPSASVTSSSDSPHPIWPPPSGRIAVFGDSGCLDRAHRTSAHCHGLLLRLLRYLTDAALDAEMAPAENTLLHDYIAVWRPGREGFEVASPEETMEEGKTYVPLPLPRRMTLSRVEGRVRARGEQEEAVSELLNDGTGAQSGVAVDLEGDFFFKPARVEDTARSDTANSDAARNDTNPAHNNSTNKRVVAGRVGRERMNAPDASTGSQSRPGVSAGSNAASSPASDEWWRELRAWTQMLPAWARGQTPMCPAMLRRALNVVSSDASSSDVHASAASQWLSGSGDHSSLSKAQAAAPATTTTRSGDALRASATDALLTALAAAESSSACVRRGLAEQWARQWAQLEAKHLVESTVSTASGNDMIDAALGRADQDNSVMNGASGDAEAQVSETPTTVVGGRRLLSLSDNVDNVAQGDTQDHQENEEGIPDTFSGAKVSDVIEENGSGDIYVSLRGVQHGDARANNSRDDNLDNHVDNHEKTRTDSRNDDIDALNAAFAPELASAELHFGLAYLGETTVTTTTSTSTVNVDDKEPWLDGDGDDDDDDDVTWLHFGLDYLGSTTITNSGDDSAHDGKAHLTADESNYLADDDDYSDDTCHRTDFHQLSYTYTPPQSPHPWSQTPITMSAPHSPTPFATTPSSPSTPPPTSPSTSPFPSRSTSASVQPPPTTPRPTFFRVAPPLTSPLASLLSSLSRITVRALALLPARTVHGLMMWTSLIADVFRGLVELMMMLLQPCFACAEVLFRAVVHPMDTMAMIQAYVNGENTDLEGVTGLKALYEAAVILYEASSCLHPLSISPHLSLPLTHMQDIAYPHAPTLQTPASAAAPACSPEALMTLLQPLTSRLSTALHSVFLLLFHLAAELFHVIFSSLLPILSLPVDFLARHPTAWPLQSSPLAVLSPLSTLPPTVALSLRVAHLPRVHDSEASNDEYDEAALRYVTVYTKSDDVNSQQWLVQTVIASYVQDDDALWSAGSSYTSLSTANVARVSVNVGRGRRSEDRMGVSNDESQDSTTSSSIDTSRDMSLRHSEEETDEDVHGTGESRKSKVDLIPSNANSPSVSTSSSRHNTPSNTPPASQCPSLTQLASTVRASIAACAYTHILPAGRSPLELCPVASRKLTAMLQMSCSDAATDTDLEIMTAKNATSDILSDSPLNKTERADAIALSHALNLFRRAGTRGCTEPADQYSTSSASSSNTDTLPSTSTITTTASLSCLPHLYRFTSAEVKTLLSLLPLTPANTPALPPTRRAAASRRYVYTLGLGCAITSLLLLLAASCCRSCTQRARARRRALRERQLRVRDRKETWNEKEEREMQERRQARRAKAKNRRRKDGTSASKRVDAEAIAPTSDTPVFSVDSTATVNTNVNFDVDSTSVPLLVPRASRRKSTLCQLASVASSNSGAAGMSQSHEPLVHASNDTPADVKVSRNSEDSSAPTSTATQAGAEQPSTMHFRIHTNPAPLSTPHTPSVPAPPSSPSLLVLPPHTPAPSPSLSPSSSFSAAVQSITSRVRAASRASSDFLSSASIAPMWPPSLWLTAKENTRVIACVRRKKVVSNETAGLIDSSTGANAPSDGPPASPEDEKGHSLPAVNDEMSATRNLTVNMSPVVIDSLLTSSAPLFSSIPSSPVVSTDKLVSNACQDNGKAKDDSEEDVAITSLGAEDRESTSGSQEAESESPGETWYGGDDDWWYGGEDNVARGARVLGFEADDELIGRGADADADFDAENGLEEEELSPADKDDECELSPIKRRRVE